MPRPGRWGLESSRDARTSACLTPLPCSQLRCTPWGGERMTELCPSADRSMFRRSRWYQRCHRRRRRGIALASMIGPHSPTGGEIVAQTVDRQKIDHLRDALAERNIAMEYYDTGAEALARLQELVPLGTEAQPGSSTPLDQMGFTGWPTELHEAGKLRYFRAEAQHNSAPAIRNENRRQALLAPYFLGSVNAL